MRLLFLTSSFPRREGDYAGIFILDLAKALQRAGHNVTVIAPHYPGSSTRDEIAGVTVHRFTYALPDRQQRIAYGRFIPIVNLVVALQIFPLMLSMFIKAINTIKETNAEVIVAFWTFPQAFVGVLLKKIFNLPLVTRAQSSDIHTGRSIGSFMISMMSRIYTISDKVVPNSDYTKNLLPSFNNGDEKTTVVREGINVEKFQRKDATEKTGTRRLLTVARLIERKGIRTLLYAMKKVVVKVEDVELYIVGEGPDRIAFEGLGLKLGLQKCVTFTGRISDEALIDHYNSCEVFVFPSTEEALGVVSMEAMWINIPVVASNIGGIPEVVINNKTGILTRPGNPESLADAIIFLLDNPKIAQEYGRNGHKHVLENFTWEKIAGDFEKVLFETL